MERPDVTCTTELPSCGFLFWRTIAGLPSCRHPTKALSFLNGHLVTVYISKGFRRHINSSQCFYPPTTALQRHTFISNSDFLFLWLF